MTETLAADTFCEVHPTRETSLRCNRCGRLMCSDCAVHTPTGYRCKECVKNQQRIFDTALWYDYVIAVAVSGLLSFIGSWISVRIGWIILIILLAPVVGIVIAEVVRRLTGRRRSKNLFRATAIAAFVGALPLALITLFAVTQGFYNLFTILLQAYYLFIVPTTVYTRHSGLQIRRK
ncbi:MAG: hypothetical protein R3335_07435 [Anaerolineales bacterium]|nr:hypothetical protein [Anaerolineales bacterium]